MKVLIAGATGLIGQELVNQCLAANISVNYLTTNKSKIVSEFNYKGYFWDPANRIIDAEAFNEVTAVVNLAGATVSRKWTREYKELILESRVESAALLLDSLKNTEHSVTQYVSASGISIYPGQSEILFREDSQERDDSFLSEVTLAWEVAADRFEELGIKVAKVRTGIVLAAQGGALPQMVKPIKLGLGAPLAGGKQWQSWIHLEDVAGIYLYLLMHGFEGIYNAVSPNPVTNKRFTQVLAKHLKRPLWLPSVPSFVLRLLLGEMADLVIDGPLVSAHKIEDSGYSFKFVNLEPAIADLL